MTPVPIPLPTGEALAEWRGGCGVIRGHNPYCCTLIWLRAGWGPRLQAELFSEGTWLGGLWLAVSKPSCGQWLALPRFHGDLCARATGDRLVGEHGGGRT